MIECPACGYRLRPGTIFCTHCGVYLAADVPLPTEPLPEEELPAVQAQPWSAVAGGYEGAEIPANATTLRITVVRNYREAVFPLPIDQIALGRGDVSRGLFPDLDLALDGGFDEGVSREHARIYQTGNRLFVEDVGSTNGTFLNDQRISPHLPHVLQEGDTLQLGRLRLRVRFDRSTRGSGRLALPEG
jgi:hypothetical protein